MKKKTMKRVVAGCLVLGILASVGIGAYLTDTETKTDVYTVGNVQAEIVANGDMEVTNAGYLLPGTVHTYERAATNTGINDAYVFMSITIPYEMVGVSEDDGTQIGERVRQLFTPGVDGGYIGSEWKLVDVGYIGQYEIEDNGQYCGEHDKYSAVVGDTITYVYGYIGDNADGSLKALKSGETTSNLVETMELTNLYHADKIDGEISTKLYAIQSNNVNGGLTDVNGVWAVINKAISGEVREAATLTYSVRNTNTGDAVGFAPLRLVNENGDTVAFSVATESGNGQFQNVPAGNYTVETDAGELSITGGATGFARSGVSVEVIEDASVNLGLTTKQNTLVVGTEFNGKTPFETTSILFTNETISNDAFDVSEAKDGSVMAWVDGTTMYVSAVDGGTIYANPNSDLMFMGKMFLEDIDTEYLNTENILSGNYMFAGDSNLNCDVNDFNFANLRGFRGAFEDCDWLTEYTIPEGTTSIPQHSFSFTGLTSITIPSTVTEIGDYAFSNCEDLIAVTIKDGSNLKYIGESAFVACISLEMINFAGTEAQWNTIELGTYWNDCVADNFEVKFSGDNSDDTEPDGTIFDASMVYVSNAIATYDEQITVVNGNMPDEFSMAFSNTATFGVFYGTSSDLRRNGDQTTFTFTITNDSDADAMIVPTLKHDGIGNFKEYADENPFVIPAGSSAEYTVTVELTNIATKNVTRSYELTFEINPTE